MEESETGASVRSSELTKRRLAPADRDEAASSRKKVKLVELQDLVNTQHSSKNCARDARTALISMRSQLQSGLYLYFHHVN